MSARVSSRKENRASLTRHTSQVRIVGGRWRGRKISFPDVPGLRPTGDRIRETLFNWLAPVVHGARCLDLFAGSGALGFEALSRGAVSCVFVDQQPVAVTQLKDTAQLLGADTAVVVGMDAQHWLDAQHAAFDVVFLDPPFAAATLQAGLVLPRLVANGGVVSGGWCYIEQPVAMSVPVLPEWRLHREQVAGAVRFMLWQFMGTVKSDSDRFS